jgi:hypothetical protein
LIGYTASYNSEFLNQEQTVATKPAIGCFNNGDLHCAAYVNGAVRRIMERTLNPSIPPPTHATDRNAGDSDADGRSAASTWVKLAPWLIPATLGICLALNFGGLDGRLQYSVMRSPGTITATTFIRETFHPRLYDLEQDLLAHLPLLPYFLLYAIALTLLLSPQASPGLLMFPMAYAVVFASQILLSSGYFESMGLRWYHMIPSAIYVFCYVPITKIGIDVVARIRTSGFALAPKLLGLFLVFAIIVLCIAFVPTKSLQPLMLLTVLCVLAYMTHKPIEPTTNDPIDRSGGSAAS